MKTRKQKIKMLKTISVVYFSVMSFMLLFPPITALFDRNDIWIGIMPLSQFYILFFCGLIVVGMGILFAIDKKIEEGNKNE